MRNAVRAHEGSFWGAWAKSCDLLIGNLGIF